MVEIKVKNPEKIIQGKKNRAKGALFETKVRLDLESKGWTVTKWMNTVDNIKDRVVASKRKYNPFTRALAIGTGFPDLLCFKKNKKQYDVIGVEVKTNGSLTQIEKGMCIWYLEKKIFPKIFIARKKKEGRRVIVQYEDFKVKYIDKLDKKKK